jgi:hypothetical protein
MGGETIVVSVVLPEVLRRSQKSAFILERAYIYIYIYIYIYMFSAV